MLGDRQEAAAELAQWWDGVRDGGDGSHAVLLTGPPDRGRSAVLGQLTGIIGRAGAPGSLIVGVRGRSLPAGPGPQAGAVRDALLGAGVRRQAAALLCGSRLRGAARPGRDRLLESGMAGAIWLLTAGAAAAAAGGAADDRPAAEDGAAARAARVVAAVSESAPVAVLIDHADCLDPGMAVTVIENLIRHHSARVLVVAAVDPGSDLAAALTSRAQRGPTVGRVHRAAASPRTGDWPAVPASCESEPAPARWHPGPRGVSNAR
jgi:hypothetical protein